MKIKMIKLYHGDHVIGYGYFCPACKYRHWTRILDSDNEGYTIWDFNGDIDNPTFSPSVKHTTEYGEPHRPDKICHYYIINSEIRYETDCTHELAGQTIPMIPIEEEYK